MKIPSLKIGISIPSSTPRQPSTAALVAELIILLNNAIETIHFISLSEGRLPLSKAESGKHNKEKSA